MLFFEYKPKLINATVEVSSSALLINHYSLAFYLWQYKLLRLLSTCIVSKKKKKKKVFM